MYMHREGNYNRQGNLLQGLTLYIRVKGRVRLTNIDQGLVWNATILLGHTANVQCYNYRCLIRTKRDFNFLASSRIIYSLLLELKQKLETAAWEENLTSVGKHLAEGKVTGWKHGS